MIYLKAYQAYQQGNHELCLKLLQEIREGDIMRLDLEAQIFLQKREYQKAYDIYYDLLATDCGYAEERKENILTVIVCAQLDKPGVLKTRGNDQIPSLEDIVQQVELITLKDSSVEDVQNKSEPSKKCKKNKKKKKRLPKQYDLVAGPDPERWLPRRDRKGNKQKKRRQRLNVKGKTRTK